MQKSSLKWRNFPANRYKVNALNGQGGTMANCPKCGKQMVKRTGKKGEFMACTGYPECKHTENIDGAPASDSTVHSGTENVKIVGAGSDGDKKAAVKILEIALANSLTVAEVVAKYKEVLKRL
jgi:ssDNA-binding Zn-finger/Zn-ribbon topoisomerase 1